MATRGPGYLSLERIKGLLKTAQKRSPKQPPAWPSQADKVRILQALQQNQQFVFMEDGSEFHVEKISQDTVYVKPVEVNKFVPRGYIEIKSLEQAVAELENDA